MVTNQIILHFLLVAQHIFCFLLSETSYATKIPKGLSLQMVHRDSPNSPVYRANLSIKERMEKNMEISTARVRSLARSHADLNKSWAVSPEDVIIRPQLGIQASNYFVRLGIGTFEDEYPTYRTYYLAIDTGSDLTWTQCEGCENHACFHQVDPYFPFYRSTTWRPYPCDLCPPEAECEDNKCILTEYADGSQATTMLGTEVFTFESERNYIHIAIPQIIFGCGFEMINFLEGQVPHNKVSGLMGLSHGFYGFMEQTEMTFNKQFSYCLQSVFNQGGSPMYLRFGNAILKQGMQSTRMFRNNDDDVLYHLNLEGISVDGQILNIPRGLFEIKSDGNGGCIIDSGTTYTTIIKGAFGIFRRAVVAFIKRKNGDTWRQMRKPEMGHSLCFHRYLNSDTTELPQITFHFENNANFEIKVEESFFFSTSTAGKDMICLMYNESDMTNLGSIQQANKDIVYDIQNELLLFAPADCSQQVN